MPPPARGRAGCPPADGCSSRACIGIPAPMPPTRRTTPAAALLRRDPLCSASLAHSACPASAATRRGLCTDQNGAAPITGARSAEMSDYPAAIATRPRAAAGCARSITPEHVAISSAKKSVWTRDALPAPATLTASADQRSRSSIFFKPACAQPSSRLPPGAPAAPIAPTTSFPIFTTTPPPKKRRCGSLASAAIALFC